MESVGKFDYQPQCKFDTTHNSASDEVDQNLATINVIIVNIVNYCLLFASSQLSLKRIFLRSWKPKWNLVKNFDGHFSDFETEFLSRFETNALSGSKWKLHSHNLDILWYSRIGVVIFTESCLEFSQNLFWESHRISLEIRWSFSNNPACNFPYKVPFNENPLRILKESSWDCHRLMFKILM